MDIYNLLLKNRSYRRFDETYRISKKELVDIVSYSRLAPSAANLQPLKFYIVFEKDLCDELFPNTFWAGYLGDLGRPTEGERPTAYIVICIDKDIIESPIWDVGIMAQTLMLASVEEGFGGCILGSFIKEKFINILNLPDNLEPNLVLALGKPIEDIQIVDVIDNNIKYYRDASKKHYVPKRKISDTIINY